MLLHSKYMVLTFHPRQGPLVWRKPVRRFVLHSKESKPCHICVQLQKCWWTCSHRYMTSLKSSKRNFLLRMDSFWQFPKHKNKHFAQRRNTSQSLQSWNLDMVHYQIPRHMDEKNELQVQESCWDSSQQAAEGMRISTLGACLWLKSSLHVQWLFFLLGLVLHMPVSC